MATFLSQLVDTSQRVAATTSRTAKRDALAELLRRLDPEEIETAVASLIGETVHGKLGIGPAVIRAARPTTSAQQSTLRIGDVQQMLASLARVGGAGATAQRTQLLRDLLVRATASEQDFLLRLLFGELRQGALEGLMIEAIARAAQLPLSDVRRAAMFAGGAAAIARTALVEGEAGLRRFTLTLFQPLQPMLAQPAEDVSEAIQQLGTAALEWKLDGARVQVHKRDSVVRVYTRGLNEVTAALPEVVEAVGALSAESLVLDGEAIALDERGRPHPFQTTMRRFGRKLDIDPLRADLPLSVFFFDLLHRNGEDVLALPARQRFELLRESMPERLLIPRVVTSEVSEADAFFRTALELGHEGIMAKSLEAPYEAGARGGSWLKIKQAHTLDLVVLAAEWGNGRRQGWLSNLHLGARDEATGAFIMLGKTFKGLTDEMLQWQTQKLLSLEVSRDRHVVYVRPELVVEIAVNEIQHSPHYPVGMALRFARVKAYRTDKRPEQADTLETVRKLFGR
ncbi:MAG TPA: ATP-dependent DNA ligase [Burkholderiales bacterium]|nr:ATP-dependent DNA ligase [Burkholderiales bacterium]